MKKLKFSLVLSVMIGILLIIFSNRAFAATSNMMPTPTPNVRRYLKRYSSIASVSSGYMRVYCDTKTKKIGIEYYDDNFNIKSKKTINMELELWGGFYAGKDAYYIVEGQGNSEQYFDKEIVRVIKYNTDWERMGQASITSNMDLSSKGFAFVRTPFKSSGVEMTEINGKLYIATGQEGDYDSNVKMGHQGYILIEVDEDTLEGKIVNADLNHSFTQYLDSEDNSLYMLEKNEGDYYTTLKKFDINSDFSKYPQSNIFKYGGQRTSAWASVTYATVDGIALSENNILSIGTSIDQSKYNSVSKSTAYNIYLGITPKNNVAENSSKYIWLTNYTDKENAGPCFTGLEIVKINNDKFMVLWEEYKEKSEIVNNDILSKYVVHYLYINGNGEKIGQEYTVKASISDCKPIVKNNKVVFYSANGNMVDFYTIDVNTNKFDKQMYYVMGDNASWSLDSNGVLTISGEGSLFDNPENSDVAKHPLIDYNWDESGSNYDCWKEIKSLTNKIVINEGITSIPETKFIEFINITQINIPNSIETIGMGAFAYCSRLRTVYILDNVKSIGEDAFLSGSLIKRDGKYEKVVIVTIYTNEGSYAEQWAKSNNIRYEYIEDEITDTGDSGNIGDNENTGNTGNTGSAVNTENTENTDNTGNTGNTDNNDNNETTNKKIGWYQENGKWYYNNDKSIMVKNGWVLDKEKWYYLDENGVMISNCWKSIKNVWYYFDGSGVMLSNTWKLDKGKWYYLNKDGAMITNNWLSDKGKWYYLDGNGVMISNCWKSIKNVWYYFDGSGVMLSNTWKLDKGKWYYLNKDGAMITNNWLLDKSKWYYLDGSGVMVSNCWKLIKNKWYYFQSSGVIITNNWLRDKGYDYYFNSSGEMTIERKVR